MADFLTYGAAALAAKTTAPGGGTGHYLRQFAVEGVEAVAMYRERLETNRGNSYFKPLALAESVQSAGRSFDRFKITGQFDCRNSGVREAPRSDNEPGCVVQGQNPFDATPFTIQNRVQSTFPHVEAADYGSGAAAAKKRK